jgi:hypothetical protein
MDCPDKPGNDEGAHICDIVTRCGNEADMPSSAQTGLLIILAGFASLPAHAADFAGKWYGKLDSAPVITIAKSGDGYSAALDYPDITRSVQRPNDIRPLLQSIHKEIVSFEAAGNTVRFAIRNTIGSNGDLNTARDDYDLTVSEDGSQLTGTLRHTSNHEGGLSYDHVPVSVTPITLYSTDWSSRAASQAKN